MGAGEAADDVEEGVGDGLEEGGGEAGRERDAERVAEAGYVFYGDDAALAGDEELEGATGFDEAVDEWIYVGEKGRACLRGREGWQVLRLRAARFAQDDSVIGDSGI